MRPVRPSKGFAGTAGIGALACLLLACAPGTLPYPAGGDIASETAYRVEADPAKGFHSPYFLMIPPAAGLHGRRIPILIYPNNSGKSDDRNAFHEDRAARRIQNYRPLARALESVLLVPGFPRPRSHSFVYTHALDRDTFIVSDPKLARLDLQLLAMIADARDRLARAGIRTREKVLMTGFSAAGMFASRFTLLHPEHVLAAAIGSPGGWPIVPVPEYRDTPLPYPIGTFDLQTLTGKPFDAETFCAVPKFFFLGAEDTNDSVPYRGSFDPPHAERIDRLFGSTPVDRWDDAAAIYRSRDCRAEFRLYPRAGHKMSAEMRADATAFLIGILERAGNGETPRS